MSIVAAVAAILAVIFIVLWSRLRTTLTETEQKLSESQTREQEMRGMLNPEQAELQNLRDAIREKEKEITSIEEKRADIEKQFTEETKRLVKLKETLIEMDDSILFQSFGLYEPKFNFATSTQYKDRLDKIRDKQKAMIKEGTAATGGENWTVDGSKSQGKKMVADTKKLLLRAFNTECDDLIDKVKFNNVESIEKRMRASCDSLSKHAQRMRISISPRYLQLKTQELHLAYEYSVKKQEEKEELKRIRAEQREQAKLEREIEQGRKKLTKERAHCQNELDRMMQKDISAMSDDELQAFNAKKSELEAQLQEIERGIADVDYRSANQKAGYVYVISNVGSFGENVYKIGMTRRLDPMDRVDELGDASVPFNFDVHAMIFSEDAPALEAALHRAFEDRKINMVNTRREFFNVSLDEIKQVIKDNFDKTVEFTDVAPAEQYRESILMRQSISAS